MLGIGFVVLSPIVAARGYLALLFGVPLAGALITMLILRFTPRRRFRPIEFAATVLIGFLTAALLGGAPATRITVLAFVVAMTWYSAADYIVVGFRELVRPDPYRGLHWARLVAGFVMPILAMVALGTTELSAIPLVILLSVDMARGALDNYAANRRITDFSWAASLWIEIVLLAGALVIPPVRRRPDRVRRGHRRDRDAAQPGPLPARARDGGAPGGGGGRTETTARSRSRASRR